MLGIAADRARPGHFGQRRAPEKYSSLRSPIARLRYTKSAQSWTLYWRDRNLRFHRYDQLAPAKHVSVLLDEIARDPTGIFWG